LLRILSKQTVCSFSVNSLSSRELIASENWRELGADNSRISSVLISMSVGMESKVLVAISVLVIGVSCQYDLNTLNMINATQTLQDLERYGIPYGAPSYPSIYPPLPTAPDHSKAHNQSGPANSLPTHPIRPVNVTRPSLEKFINKTMSAIPSGVCIKEVP
jgi:hypothetical protein